MKLNLIIVSLLCWTISGQAYLEKGKEAPLGKGWARTFAEFNKKGGLERLGIELSEQALAGLPKTNSMVQLQLPASTGLAPYDHVTVDWNPLGHEPDHIYDKPHFDFHFYMISEAARTHIRCQESDTSICMKSPSPEFIPPKYAPTPGGVPEMGWHWVDTTSPEFNGKPFVATYIYGYYDGRLAFVEPMITLSHLLERHSMVTDVRVPSKFEKPGSYPQAYSIEYDAQEKVHRIVLQKFIMN